MSASIPQPPNSTSNDAAINPALVGSASVRHSPELILVVDDDANVRESLTEVLKQEGFSVHSACDGREAVRQFLQGPPDLILLDINMPDLNGWQAFQIMVEMYPFVAVIVITARPGQGLRAAELGIDTLMEKPLDIPTLLSTIRRLISQPNIAPPEGALEDSWVELDAIDLPSPTLIALTGMSPLRVAPPALSTPDPTRSNQQRGLSHLE